MCKIANLIEDKKGSFSRITVDGNTVEIERLKASTIDEKNPWHMKYRKSFDSITCISFGDFRYVEARTDNCLEVFNVTRCCRICSIDANEAYVIPKIVFRELFFIIIIMNDKEKCLKVFDEVGNYIDKDPLFIDVISTPFGPRILKRDKEGHKTLWTIEGHLAALP